MLMLMLMLLLLLLLPWPRDDVLLLLSHWISIMSDGVAKEEDQPRATVRRSMLKMMKKRLSCIAEEEADDNDENVSTSWC